MGLGVDADCLVASPFTLPLLYCFCPQNDLLSFETAFHDFLSPDFSSKTVMQPHKQEETTENLFKGHKVGLDPCVHTNVLEIVR